MTPLREALESAGTTQHEVAEAIGVATNTVYYWASGKKPLPAERAVQIAKLLGVDKSVFRPMLSGQGRGASVQRREPVTMLDWVVQNLFIEGAAVNYRPVVERMAEVAGVSIFEVRDWLAGVYPIPVEVAQAWAERLWLGFNPKVLAFEVERPPGAERLAVAAALSEMAGRLWDSFGDAFAELEGFKEDFAYSKPDPDEMAALLDNGRPSPEKLFSMAARFAGRLPR